MKSDIELRVLDLARGGAGVARDEQGRVIFVPYTAPGDRVRVRIIEENKRYAQGELLEILEQSPQRQVPPCPVFGICGGCQWQHLPYSLQWETKINGVLHALKRVGVKEPQHVDSIPAEKIWEYRNRVQLRGEGSRLGFFKRASKELVPIDKCYIARAEINSSLEKIRAEGSKLLRPYKVEVEVLPSGEVRSIWNSRHAAGGFRQVHDEQNEKLREWICKELPQSAILYDLFGGSGNLSFPLVAKIEEIHCVDLSSPNVSPPGTPSHFHFHRSPVLEWILNEAKHAKTMKAPAPIHGAKPNSAILDPPREGLGSEFSEICEAIHKLSVKNLIAVGCDPDAWARDVSRWLKKGWNLEKVMMIDLFPQTPHIESVAYLTRS